MKQEERLAVFKAQTANVRRLEESGSQIRRTLNAALRRGDKPSESAHTVVCALLYCAWLEALFTKLIHTPYGFDLTDLDQIKRVQNDNGIHASWRKCLELGIKRVPAVPPAGDLPGMTRRLCQLLDDYVQEPAQLRNKIAHGQWEVALNSKRTAVNRTITEQLAALDIIDIDHWYAAASGLAAIVEALIESPERTFGRQYMQEHAALEAKLTKMSTWSRTTRIARLRHKPSVQRPR